jgi:hypothetical protein
VLDGPNVSYVDVAVSPQGSKPLPENIDANVATYVYNAAAPPKARDPKYGVVRIAAVVR